MREKEEEMDKAARQNAELEAKAAQLSLEAQVWRAKAQAQEAHAATLQAQLQQAISNSISTSGAQQQDREGAGLGCAGEVEDSESAYVDPDSERRVNSPSCKVCQKRAVSVVLLPCRHLCVCGECDDVVQACPVCLSPRTASVEVYLT
uniref:RING-type domain-containing protein n=2 Tax=Opuntia streptacantha TaxID=393608 RepID=A0A7C8ZIS9_OPUST